MTLEEVGQTLHLGFVDWTRWSEMIKKKAKGPNSKLYLGAFRRNLKRHASSFRSPWQQWHQGSIKLSKKYFVASGVQGHQILVNHNLQCDDNNLWFLSQITKLRNFQKIWGNWLFPAEWSGKKDGKIRKENEVERLYYSCNYVFHLSVGLW